MSEITLEVGKKYRTRDGRAVTITQHDPDDYHLPWGGVMEGDQFDGLRWWRKDGTKRFEPAGIDLIEEILPEVESKPELQLQVGKRYRTRDGRVATITGRDLHDRLHPFRGVIEGCGPDAWTGTGRRAAIGETGDDLVEEIVESKPSAPTGESAMDQDFLRNPPRCDAPPFQLEVGKFYRNEEGAVFKIIGEAVDPSRQFPFSGVSNRSMYSSNRFNWTADGISDIPAERFRVSFDLIEEVVDPAQQFPFPGLPYEPTIRQKTLGKAERCVMGDRQNTYGTPTENFTEIAKRWSVHLGIELTATDVAIMLVDLKLARLKASPKKLDNWVDAAGYAACGAEVAGAED